MILLVFQQDTSQARETVMATFLCPSDGGCDKPKQGLTTLRLEDAPPDLMRIAGKQLPGVTFDTAFKKLNGTIEIRGKAKNGKIREVDIRPDGTVEEVG